MTIKEAIQKILKGETLTEDERKQLETYDPEAANKAAIDAAAAGARRKAEEELAKAQASLKEAVGKATALEAKVTQYEQALNNNQKQGNAELEAMRKTVDALKKRADDADAKAARLEKDQRINAIIAKAGFKYADGVDGAAINGILHAKLAALDDNGLKDIEGASTPFESALHGSLFKAHRESWKGALLDESGRGTGSPLTGKTGGSYDGVNPWKKDTRNLTRQLEISKEDAALAAKLKKEAGVVDPAF